MRKTEIVLALLIVVGLILKVLHIPGGSALTIVSIVGLSIIYWAFGFAFFNGIRFRNIFKKSSYANSNGKRIVGAIGLGFGLASALSGILFKLQFWPGAHIMLQVGIYFATPVLAIVVLKLVQTSDDYYKRLLKRAAIVTVAAVGLYLLPTAKLVDIYYGSNPEYAKLFKAVLENPDDRELREELYDMQDSLRGRSDDYLHKSDTLQ